MAGVYSVDPGVDGSTVLPDKQIVTTNGSKTSAFKARFNPHNLVSENWPDSPAGSALKVSLERRSSRSALRSPSRDSQGLPGAGLISVLRAEPGLGPDDTTRKSTETCESSSLPLLNPPSRQLTNQGSQCDHTRDISMRINLVSDSEKT
ncbi:unnamed protein product [Boreogadus saida]